MSRYILSNVGVCDETTGHRVVWIADSDGTCRRYILHTGSFAAFTHDRCLTPTVINDAHPAMPYREFVAIMDASRGDNARNYAPARDGSWHKLTSPTRRRHNIIACTLRMSARMRRRYAHADAGVIVWMSHASNCGDVIAVDYTGVIPRGARVLTCGNMQRTLGCIIVRNGRSDSGFASALRPRLSPSSSLVLARYGKRRRVCIITVFYPGHDPFRLRVSTRARVLSTKTGRAIAVVGHSDDIACELKPPQIRWAGLIGQPGYPCECIDA